MTEDMDKGIGMILDKVESLGIADNTYIIFLSDNGGRTSIPIGPEQQVARNFPLRGGKGSMYEEDLGFHLSFLGQEYPKIRIQMFL